jgi:hypothetical protein
MSIISMTTYRLDSLDKVLSIITLPLDVQGIAVANDNRLANPDHDYPLISTGKTMDVVEWTPKNHPDETSAVITSEGQVVMNCVPKGKG